MSCRRHAVAREEVTVEAGGREVEVSLRVRGGDREATMVAVARTGEIAGWRLRKRAVESLEDVYFDTPDGALAEGGTALRLRRRVRDDEAGTGAWLVTLKGEGRRLPRGGTSRMEREAGWTADAPRRVRRMLGGLGIELPAPAPSDPAGEGDGAGAATGGRRDGTDGSSPVAALRELGLEVIQRRRTRRRRLALVRADGAVGGELALDRVVYRLSSGEPGEVVHHEVEVEGRGPGAEDTVADVAAALLRRLGGALRPWEPDKLATGRAMERLARRGELAGMTEPGGRLSDRGYERIEETLHGPAA